jgi:hypothetical protein
VTQVQEHDDGRDDLVVGEPAAGTGTVRALPGLRALAVIVGAWERSTTTSTPSRRRRVRRSSTFVAW